MAVELAGAPGANVRLTLGSKLAPTGGLATLNAAGALEPAQTLYRALALPAGRTIRFRLPANWYFRIQLSGGAAIRGVIQSTP